MLEREGIADLRREGGFKLQIFLLRADLSLGVNLFVKSVHCSLLQAISLLLSDQVSLLNFLLLLRNVIRCHVVLIELIQIKKNITL